MAIRDDLTATFPGGDTERMPGRVSGRDRHPFLPERFPWRAQQSPVGGAPVRARRPSAPTSTELGGRIGMRFGPISEDDIEA